jgi:hypothetical protein
MVKLKGKQWLGNGTVEYHVEMWLKEEAREKANSCTSLAKIAQDLWPTEKKDKGWTRNSK